MKGYLPWQISFLVAKNIPLFYNKVVTRGNCTQGERIGKWGQLKTESAYL